MKLKLLIFLLILAVQTLFSANLFTETMKVQFGTSNYDYSNSITTDTDEAFLMLEEQQTK
jgi:hypothetical protein